MDFRKHYELEGKHAFLSASKYHWLNYDDDKLINTYISNMAKQRGSELHSLACDLIRLGVKLPKSKKTLNMYVNDAIGYRMTPEQPLYFSPNCFGTADAISFKNDFLRIHDLKTGETPASINQLVIYSALFCLEYDKKPNEFKTELRIYQSDEILVHEPEPEDISMVMEKITKFDFLIEKLKIEGGGL